jgi:hypothetical protein
MTRSLFITSKDGQILTPFIVASFLLLTFFQNIINLQEEDEEKDRNGN